MMSRRLLLHFAASDVWCSGWHSAAEKSLSVSVTDGLYRMHSQAPNVAISTPSQKAVSKRCGQAAQTAVETGLGRLRVRDPGTRPIVVSVLIHSLACQATHEAEGLAIQASSSCPIEAEVLDGGAPGVVPPRICTKPTRMLPLDEDTSGVMTTLYVLRGTYSISTHAYVEVKTIRSDRQQGYPSHRVQNSGRKSACICMPRGQLNTCPTPSPGQSK